MEYVRECWNQLRTPADLLESLSSKGDECFIREVITSLLQILSNTYNTMPLFLNYLESLFAHRPNIFIDILAKDSEKLGLAFIKLINQIGSKFIDIFQIDGTEQTSQCILNILTFCLELSPPEICIEALKKLSENQKFSSLIASARVHHEKEIHALRPAFHERFPPLDIPTSLPFPIALMAKAVFNDNIIHASLFQQHDLIPLILSNIMVISKMDHLARFLTRKTFNHLFVHIVSDFVINPSLVLSLLAFEIIPSFIKGNLNQLLTDLKQTKHVTKNCSDTKDSELTCGFFLDPNKIEAIFMSKPTNQPQIYDLINSVYQFPSTSVSFADRLLNIMTMENIKGFSTLVPQLQESHVDVIIYLAMQNKLTTFLEKLLNLCEKAGKDDFPQLWFIMVYYVYFSWSQGSPSIRNSLLDLFEKVSIECRFFFSTLFFLKKPNIDFTIAQPKSPLEACVQLLAQFLDNPQKLLKYISVIVKKPLEGQQYWISIILACHCNPSPDLKLLLSADIPNSPVVYKLFLNLMTILNNPNAPYKFLVNDADYDMLVRFKPSCAGDLNDILKNHILTLETVAHIKTDEFCCLTCCWRAWITAFGIQAFVNTVISVIDNLTMNFSAPSDLGTIYENVAYVFAITCDQKSDAISEILERTFVFIKESLDSMTSALGLSNLCIVLICLSEANWEMLFDRVFEFARNILDDDPHVGGIAAIFALGFIRKALFTPNMQKRVTDAPCDYLKKFNDWPTLLDYFITKARLKQLCEIE